MGEEKYQGDLGLMSDDVRNDIMTLNLSKWEYSFWVFFLVRVRTWSISTQSISLCVSWRQREENYTEEATVDNLWLARTLLFFTLIPYLFRSRGSSFEHANYTTPDLGHLLALRYRFIYPIRLSQFR